MTPVRPPDDPTTSIEPEEALAEWEREPSWDHEFDPAGALSGELRARSDVP